MAPDIILTRLKDKIPLLLEAHTIRIVDGGLTNKNYCVETNAGKYLLRVSHSFSTLLGINRDNEIVNTKRAHKTGVAPAVVYTDVEENVLMVDWIEAKTLNASDFQSHPELLTRTANALRTLHAGPSFQGDFFFPVVRRKYLKTVLENGYFMPEGYIEAEPRINALEMLLTQQPEIKVPCNNDLLAENFMDDGNKIWIIDYEYAGQNEPSFEIGNLASESRFTDEQLILFCDVYWGKHLPEKIARAMAWATIAKYGWVLWASIQEAISDINFDFRDWGKRKWDLVLSELNSVRYEKVMTVLKGK